MCFTAVIIDILLQAILQPTINQYFKKSTIIQAEKLPDQEDKTVDLPNIKGGNLVCIPGTSVCTSSKTYLNKSNGISRDSPFSKSLRKESSTPKHGLFFKPLPDITDCDHILDNADAAIEHRPFIPRKAFNLRIRNKRPQCKTVASLQSNEIKKLCSKMPCGRHLPPRISPTSSPCGDAKLESYLGYSNEDSSNPVCILDIDNHSGHIDEHSTCVRIPKYGPGQSKCKIPLLPSFSPRKRTPSSSPRKRTPSSSPLSCNGSDSIVKDNAMGETLSYTPTLFSSPALFPTPSQHLNFSATSETVCNRKSPKRVLFPQNTTEIKRGSSVTTAKKTGGKRQEEDFSFGVDISFSELANPLVSDASFKPCSSKGLNRYLVLEVVTQASTDISDCRRSDLLIYCKFLL